jgi:hypothetical protein
MPRIDEVETTFTKDEFVRKGAKLCLNTDGRVVVVFPRRERSKKFSKYSRTGCINGQTIRKKTTLAYCQKLFDSMSGIARLSTVHPTRFCGNCHRPSSYFIDRERAGHSTCTGCGVVQHLAQNNFSLRLTDDGVSNKSQWEHTPGMGARDCTITTQKGKRIGQTIKSHQRNWWRIRGKIEGIANDWHFAAMDGIIQHSKAKLKKFYFMIHNDTRHDGQDSKMPHGGAALAAACFYCAVLEFEQRVGFKTACTLPAIQESAQSCRDQKSGRKCRDVTDTKILRYSNILKKYSLCSAKIPEIGAETLRFHPKSAALQHSRMATFAECGIVKFHLPITGSWGIKVGDTKQGALYIDSCSTDGFAWNQGIRKGDYIFQLEKETIDINCTPRKFAEKITNARQRVQHKSVLELAIMRKKK